MEEDEEKQALRDKYPGAFLIEKLTEFFTKGRQIERRYESHKDSYEWGQFVRDGICFICGETDVRTFVDHHIFGRNFVFEGDRDHNNEISITIESLVITLCANCHEKNRGWGGYKKKIKIHRFSPFWKGEVEEENATKYTHYWSVLKGIESGFMFKEHPKHEKYELKIEVKPRRRHLKEGICFICGELDYRTFINHHVFGRVIGGATITLCANCHKKNNGWYDKKSFELYFEGCEIEEAIPKKVFSDELWIFPKEYWPEDVKQKYEENWQKRKDNARYKKEITLYIQGESGIIKKGGYEYRHIKNVLKEIEKGIMFS